jgi:hypothetical protein
VQVGVSLGGQFLVADSWRLWWLTVMLVVQVSNGVRLVKLISSMPPAQKARNLTAFSTDPAVSVLLMDSVGAVGLDLSFVSYVFLMEPIADRSLEEQVRLSAITENHARNTFPGLRAKNLVYSALKGVLLARQPASERTSRFSLGRTALV